MNVGDYVRFYDRDWTEIGQIVGEVEDSHLKVVKCRDGYYDLDNFIKTSPNIIDLIEVGDYVNGVRVDKIILKNDKEICFRYVYALNEDENDVYTIRDIKSIVTKEQFESMEYRL